MQRPVSNPPNPWSSTHVEWLGEPPQAQLTVYEEEARSILAQITSAVTRKADVTTAWVAELREAETKAMAKLQQWANTDSTPMNHYRLARSIAESIDDDTIVIGDGGDCVALGAKLLPRDKPGTWMDPGPLGCLGIGAPFAIAAKKLHPGKKVLVLSGDGSFGLNGFDFETCVRAKIPIMSILFNNFAMAMEFEQMDLSRKKYGSTDISGCSCTSATMNASTNTSSIDHRPTNSIR